MLDDLLAARVLYQQHPQLRHGIAQALRALEDAAQEAERGAALGEAGARPGPPAFRSLLGDLLRAGAITREQAEQVFGLVERFKRGRAVGIYGQLLAQEGRGVAEAVQATIVALGQRADCVALADALVRAGHIDAERAAHLRFKAKVAFDLDQQTQLAAYRERRAAESASTLVGGGSGSGTDVELETLRGEGELPSGIYRNEIVVPDEAETTGILDRAALREHLALDAPRFPVPDWIVTTDPLLGRRIGGYRVLGRVGAGAMATVYLADHEERAGPIALKLLSPRSSPERQARFKREILANGFFSHENVIDVYDAGVASDGHHYLAMEFFDGADLDAVLAAEGTLSLRQSLTVVRQVALALDAAHAAGIVHRDVKPANILVSAGTSVAKLMDFGIALIRDLGEFKDKVFESDAGGVTGTPEYLAPEQAFRDPVGPPTDLYALGMVFYRCLAGRLPFRCESVSGWVHSHMTEQPLPLDQAVPEGDWPDGLLDLFARLFVKEPRRRLQSGREVVERIDAIALELGSGRRSRLLGRVRRGY